MDIFCGLHSALVKSTTVSSIDATCANDREGPDVRLNLLLCSYQGLGGTNPEKTAGCVVLRSEPNQGSIESS